MANKKRWLGLTFMLVAMFMDILDLTIVNVAIPSIQRNMHMTYSAIQWITAGYALSYSLLLIVGGRLGDIYGRKRMFMAGASLFTLASLLSGVAPNEGVLIVARFVQGAMAAVMVPQVLATVQVAFPASEERGKVMGLIGGLSGLAGIAGPLLGGMLINWNPFGLDWRSIFLVNVPIGLIGIVGAFFTVEESRSPEKVKVDIPGVALITTTLLLLVYPLIQGRELGWPLWTYLSMAAAVPCFWLFLSYERRKNAAQASPLLVLSPFKRRSFWGGLIVLGVLGEGLFSFMFVFSLWMQSGLGFSAIHAGLTYLPFSLGIPVAIGVLSSAFATRLGRGVVRAGAVLLIVGLVMLVYTLHRYGTNVTSWEMAPALFLYGLGFGFLYASLFNFIFTHLKSHEAGSASGMISTVQQLGGVVGITVIGVIFFSFIGSQANQSFSAYAPRLEADLQSHHMPASTSHEIVRAMQACFHDRATEKDPTVTPTSCKATSGHDTSPAVAATIAEVTKNASRKDFTASLSRSLWVEIGILVIMVLVVSVLPKRAKAPKDVALV